MLQHIVYDERIPTQDYFLELELTKNYLLGTNILSPNEDTNVKLNVEETVKNYTFNIEEEPHVNKYVSHSGFKINRIDLDREWTGLIVKHMKKFPHYSDIELFERKNEDLS